MAKTPVSKRAAVAIFGDLHCGSTLGLFPPQKVYDDEGNGYVASAAQNHLWKCWEDFTGKFREAKKGRKSYAVANGDLIDGDHHNTAQIVTRNLAVQRRVAIACIEPLVELADYFFVIRGTSTHTGKLSTEEEKIGENFENTQYCQYKDHETASWWSLVAEFGKTLFDISHHIGGGGRRWTAGGPAVRLASEIVMDYAGAGLPIPRYAFRSHIHTYHDSFDNVEGCRGVILPAWQLRTEFGHRIAAHPPDVGGAIIQIDGDHQEVKIVRYSIPRLPTWRPPS